jgi:hypothetical protein
LCSQQFTAKRESMNAPSGQLTGITSCGVQAGNTTRELCTGSMSTKRVSSPIA